MKASLALLLFWLLCLCVASSPQTGFQPSPSKQLVVACNAFADGRPAIVGVRAVKDLADASGVDTSGPTSMFVRRLRERRRKAIAASTAVHAQGTPLVAEGQGGVAAMMQLRPNPSSGQTGAAVGRGISAAAAAAYAAATGASGKKEEPVVVARGRLRSAQKPPASRPPPSPLASAMWIRSLEFGQCEEYRVDLSTRKFFFLAPGRRERTELVPPAPVSGNPIDATGHDAFADPLAAASHLIPDTSITDAWGTGLSMHAAAPTRIADRVLAVLMQPEASAAPAMRSLALVHHSLGNRQPAAELAAVDGYTQAPDRQEGFADTALKRMERSKGLKPLLPLDSGAVVRLEDIIERGSISSEVLGSKTMGLGASYAVEPSHFHLMLEDIRGAHMLDKRTVVFQGGHTYVAIRAGRGASEKYPEHLIFHEVQDADSSWGLE